MLETYPGAPAAKEALIILVNSYNNLNMYKLAKEAADVLLANYSDYTYVINDDSTVSISDKNKTTQKTSNDSFFGLGLF